ncbi:MAG: serine/threonine-protein kinase [Planctomycetota bacterium]
MPELRCSVCGVLTLETEPGAHASAPEPECALTSGPAKHIVCATCTTKLSIEIAKGRTSIVQPLDPALTSRDDASLDPDFEHFLKKDTLPPVASEKPNDPASPSEPNGAEFDFARKRQFAGYELLGEISRGSFGVVYKARQAGLDRVVALKVLLDGVHASQEAIERFNREAKSVARLKHPNVVPIYDIGACDGHHYFAMEFIEGHPLAHHILARTITIPDALLIAERIADAIESAHKAGVIHRDIKPTNILVDKHGVPHITDFGLAKQIDIDNKYTMSGTTLGTPAYMPPEQARGQITKIDARSDVYALGTVLYEMLTGVTPFSGRSLLEVVVAVINEPVPPPRQLNPKIHRDIQTIVLKCLEKERAGRYASAADLRDDIRRFRSGEAILARPAGIISTGWRFLKRHQWYIASAAAVAMAFGGSLLLVADSRKKDAQIATTRKALDETVEKIKDKEQIKWKKIWGFSGSDGLEPGRMPVYSSEGRLGPADTLVSHEGEILFGDWRANLEFTLTEEAAARGFTAGIQSVTDIGGVPYVVALKGNTVKLWGPSDLYAFWNHFRQNRDSALPLEIKLEKEIPPLVPGYYRLAIERNGIYLKFKLTGDPSPSDAVPFTFLPNFNPELSPASQPPLAAQSLPPWGPVQLEIQDYNLSNWIMKQTQLVLRRPPGGLLVQGGDAHYKLGGPGGLEVSAQNYFYGGEYKFAAIDFGVVAQSGDELNQARAKYFLGLISEISANGQMDDVIASYLDAKDTLSHLHPARNSPLYRDQVELLKEIRIRLAVCYARKSDWKNAADRWQAVDEELAQGWMNNARVGEALGWELQNILDLAQREPNKDAVIVPALNIFKRSGLDPLATRITENAKVLGMLLSFKGRFAELRELYNAVPTPALNDAFADAAGRALTAQQPDEAVKLLTFLPLESAKLPSAKPSKLATRASDVVSVLARARRWQDAQTLLVRYPSPEAFRHFFDELPADSVTADVATVFYSECLPKLFAAMPRDEATRVSCDRAIDRWGRNLCDTARFSELLPLHVAIRHVSPKYDPRLAAHFADAVEKLAAASDAESDELALKLLKYASERVARSQAGLRQAAIEIARRKAAAGDDVSFKYIIRIKVAYPSSHLAPFARQALRDYCQARRYDEAVAYFSLARSKFTTDGAALLPDLIAALENSEGPVREKMLDTVWTSVRDELKRVEDDSASRQWQLDFGDIQLALANWNGARKNYQVLLETQNLDPVLAAKAALRLAALNQAHPVTTPPGDAAIPAKDDALATVLTHPSTPPDIILAAQALATTAAFKAQDLPAKIKAIPSPVLTLPEWTLIFALRARLDGDEPAAQQFLKQALERAQPDRLWTAALASDLLRTRKVAADATKPEAEDPP